MSDNPAGVKPNQLASDKMLMAESSLGTSGREIDSNPRLTDDYTKTVKEYISDGDVLLVGGVELNDVRLSYPPPHTVFKRLNPEKFRKNFSLCFAAQRHFSQQRTSSGTKLPQ